jgi:hypothetical protein
MHRVVAVLVYELFLEILISHRVGKEYYVEIKLAVKIERLTRPADVSDASLGEQLARLQAIFIDVDETETVILRASFLVENGKSYGVVLLC